MVFAVMLLITLGIIVATMGFKLFRVILPLVGFVSGLMVGFGGFQGVFGKGAVSTTIAVMVAVIVGVILMLLSFAFFEIALVVIAAIFGASVMSFLSISLGLDKEGFLVFMMALAGGIIAGILASGYPIGVNLVIVLTSVVGVAMLMAGIMLVVGNVSVQDLNNQGIVSTVLKVVDQSFLWFFVWLGGSLLAIQLQTRTLAATIAGDAYQFEPKRK